MTIIKTESNIEVIIEEKVFNALAEFIKLKERAENIFLQKVKQHVKENVVNGKRYEILLEDYVIALD